MYKCVFLGKLTILKFSSISESISDPMVSLCKAMHLPVSDAPSLSVCSTAQPDCSTFTEIPYVFCNICASTQCDHSPSIINVDGALKLSYNSDVIAQGVIPSFAAPRSFSVPLNIMSYNCMHMADDENDNMVSNERALFLDSLAESFPIICLQEARSSPGKKFAPGYVIFFWPSQPQPRS